MRPTAAGEAGPPGPGSAAAAGPAGIAPSPMTSAAAMEDRRRLSDRSERIGDRDVVQPRSQTFAGSGHEDLPSVRADREGDGAVVSVCRSVIAANPSLRPVAGVIGQRGEVESGARSLT